MRRRQPALRIELAGHMRDALVIGIYKGSCARSGCRVAGNCQPTTRRKSKSIYSSIPRIMALVGTPVPAVTNTFLTPSTWFTDAPRICRTPSAMPFMP